MAKILICTGIYPPQIGGPAQYALELVNELKRRGNDVKVLTYGLERKLPILVRHELFFWRTLFNLRGVDFVLVLDTFSVGWPATVAARFLGKKIIIRTGGDFLWESYVERTGDLVLLNNFYDTRKSNLNWKEKIIFGITKWVLQNVDAMIFSTEWQKRIFERAYSLDSKKNFIVENFYGDKLPPAGPRNRVFVAGTRQLKWKNLSLLEEAFAEAQKVDPTLQIDFSNSHYQAFVGKIQKSYAVILTSLGDISPNMILDALRTNTPFILTRETGLYDKLKDVALFVDPENAEDIKRKILYLSDKDNYEIQRRKIESFQFTHTWKEICDEILEIVHKIK